MTTGQIMLRTHAGADHSGGNYHGPARILRHARLLRQRDPVIRVVAGGNGSRKQGMEARSRTPDQRRRSAIAVSRNASSARPPARPACAAGAADARQLGPRQITTHRRNHKRVESPSRGGREKPFLIP